MTSATHSHVFYTDRANGWCSQLRDDEGNQATEDASYFYLKSDAVLDAVDKCLPVHIYGKDGLYQFAKFKKMPAR